jgi:predicted GNAT family acetyltransferase
MSDVRDNTEGSRFEINVDGNIAFSEYLRTGDRLTIRHTEVPKALEGRGIGSALARGLLDLARTQKLKVKPLCPFVAGYIKKHPEYADLLA